MMMTMTMMTRLMMMMVMVMTVMIKMMTVVRNRFPRFSRLRGAFLPGS